jgi:hypothetical protein
MIIVVLDRAQARSPQANGCSSSDCLKACGNGHSLGVCMEVSMVLQNGQFATLGRFKIVDEAWAKCMLGRRFSSLFSLLLNGLKHA